MPSFLTRRDDLRRRASLSPSRLDRRAQRRGLRRCARGESFHGHSYTCDVTVTGEIDSVTGMIVDLGLLDRVLAAEVRDRFDHRNINLDVPEFADGQLVPTGEELARFIFARVQLGLGTAATVVSVTVAEDATLSATYRDE